MSVLNGRGRGDMVARILVETPTRMSAPSRRNYWKSSAKPRPATNVRQRRASSAGFARLWAARLFSRSISSRSAKNCANSSAAAWTSRLGSRASPAIAAEFPSFAVARRTVCGGSRGCLVREADRALSRRASASAPHRTDVSAGWRRENRDGFICAVGENGRTILRKIARRGEASAAALGAFVLPHQRHPVVAGQRAHPAGAAVEQGLAAGCLQVRQSVRQRFRTPRQSWLRDSARLRGSLARR